MHKAVCVDRPCANFLQENEQTHLHLTHMHPHTLLCRSNDMPHPGREMARDQNRGQTLGRTHWGVEEMVTVEWIAVLVRIVYRNAFIAPIVYYHSIMVGTVYCNLMGCIFDGMLSMVCILQFFFVRIVCCKF